MLFASFADGTSFGVTSSSYVTYSSTNTAVATVDSTGLVIAVAPGSGTITVTYALGSNNNQISVPVIVPNPSNAPPPPPTITNLSPNSGTFDTSVTITGTNFGTTQGTSTVTFNGAAATPCSTCWSATTITVAVPNGATTGNVVATVGGQASNGISFTVVSLGHLQGSSNSLQGSQATVAVSYASPQASGDLNVVVVGSWGGTIQSVTDSAGNTYALAIGPTSVGYCQGNGVNLTIIQSIYYAKNIRSSSGGNSVTVTFSRSGTSPVIKVAECAGLSPTNPLDVAVGRSGIGIGYAASSGSATTTNAHDLLIAADISDGGSNAPGTGYTTRLLPRDILEDEIVTQVGTYSAGAALNSFSNSCATGVTRTLPNFVMQMVASRAAN